MIRTAFRTVAATLPFLALVACSGETGNEFSSVDAPSPSLSAEAGSLQPQGRHGSHEPGTCWYFNKHTRSVVDTDHYGARKSCSGPGWYDQCRDHMPSTVEIGCFRTKPWQNSSGGWQDSDPMGTSGPMGVGGGTGTNPNDPMGTTGPMGAGGGTGTDPNDPMGTTGPMGAGGGTGTPIPSLASFGIRLTNGNQPLPASWSTLRTAGLKLTPAQQACNWAVRPNIYAFTDGVVYADAAETNINVFSHDMVRSFGCIVPPINGQPVQAPVTEPLRDNAYKGEGQRYEAPALADFGVAVDNASHPRDGRFHDMVRGAVRIKQADHVCKWAVRPLIYVFADGIVYSKIDGTDFNVFSFETARANGCFIPTVYRRGTSPTNPPAAPDPMTDTLGKMGETSGSTTSTPSTGPTAPAPSTNPTSSNDIDMMGG